mgnify:CR=1 FL=1
MRNNAIAFLVICLLVMAVYGCSGEPGVGGTNNNVFGGGNSKQTQGAMPTYNTGLTGIKMDFLPNSPPVEMYDGQVFPFSLEIFNT